MPAFKVARILMGIAVFGVLGCTKADKKPDGNNGSALEGDATFYIKSLEGDGLLLNAPPAFVDPTKIEASVMNNLNPVSGWHVPRSVAFMFQACIQDQATNSDARGHRFLIENPVTKQTVESMGTTTRNGCFKWQETLPFNYFVGQSKWVVVSRDIVGTGVHSGRQRVKLALNPWAIGHRAREGSGKAVYFLRDEAFPVSQLAETAEADDTKLINTLGGHGLGQDKLLIEGVDIQTIRQGERNTGTYLRLNISMEPRVVFADSLGRGPLGGKPLDSGEFEIFAHLVQSGVPPHMKDHVILTSGFNSGDNKGLGIRSVARIRNGKLVARVDAWVDAKVPQGNLELVLKVKPTITGLKAFEGIYELGNMRSLSSSFGGKLSEKCLEKGPCNTETYLTNALNFKEAKDEFEKKRQSIIQPNFPYLFDRMKLRFVQVESEDETATQRTVRYSASVCITEAFTGSRVEPGLPFRIRYQDTGQVIEQSTAEDGCLNWDAQIFHRYYYPEEFIEKVVTIEKDTGVSRTLKFYINPWDDKFTFGFDEREFGPSFWDKFLGRGEGNVRRKKPESRFFIAEFGYHTVRFQYNIDSLMNLEVRKTVLMELSPRVLRYSGIINARKMTEPLRDGIWLMKVGIQKSYLDPTSSGVSIKALDEARSLVRLNNEPEKAESLKSVTRLRKDLKVQAPSKEFITTQTALVRVTDGVIIQPVELRMQDLRLMRVRSNFLIQFEAVDERKIRAENYISRKFNEGIEELLKDRDKKREEQKQRARELHEKHDQGQKVDWAKEAEEDDKLLEKTVQDRINVLKPLVDEINQLLNTGEYHPLSLKERKLEGTFAEEILKGLGVEINGSDFTNLKLPSCEDVDCSKFLEPKSGLEKRTFVGPVIFLNNAYRDSVRATDNLDEAKCGVSIEVDDEFAHRMRSEADKLFRDSTFKAADKRANTIYRYSEYFSSLKHLCGQSVDDLIKREREDRELQVGSGPALGSVYNFTQNFGYDFLSLSDEIPKHVEISEKTVHPSFLHDKCGGSLVNCMEEKTDRWIQVERALRWINQSLSSANWSRSRIKSLIWDMPKVKDTEWNVEDLRKALFETKRTEPQLRYASCSLLAGQVIDWARRHQPEAMKRFIYHENTIHRHIMESCLYDENAYSVDRKLRIFDIGSKGGDSYVFLGGLQLNVNVGQSFGVSKSDSYSWSVSSEVADFISPLSGFASVARSLPYAKLVALKGGYSNSFSDSVGTSIAESTYLVAQIAKFRVRLDSFEQCVGIRLSQDMLGRASNHVPFEVRKLLRDPRAQRSLGLFVCEGRKNTEPRDVDETYFYFTQHFTEGDMLDQADLYNHPWLLGLRGQRDYAVFANMIRAQEVVSFWNYAKNIFEPKHNGEVGWPLDHMTTVYKQMTPTFPGFYTVLDHDERLTDFPLERQADQDINCEVISADRRQAPSPFCKPPRPKF